MSNFQSYFGFLVLNELIIINFNFYSIIRHSNILRDLNNNLITVLVCSVYKLKSLTYSVYLCSPLLPTGLRIVPIIGHYGQ